MMQSLKDVKAINNQIKEISERLEFVRNQRLEASQEIQQTEEKLIEKQHRLQDRLSNRRCDTFIYLNSVSPQDDSIPSSIVFKMAKMCSYLHNIEVNKVQMKLFKRQGEESIKYNKQIRNHLIEESSNLQIDLVKQIIETKTQIADLKNEISTLTNKMTCNGITDRKTSEKRPSHCSIISEFQGILKNGEEKDLSEATASASRIPETRLSILERAKSAVISTSQRQLSQRNINASMLQLNQTARSA